jgi:hypothetical protein
MRGRTPAGQQDLGNFSPERSSRRQRRPGSNPPWCVERVKVTVRASDGKQHHFGNYRLRKVKDNRRLHERYGERLFLCKVTTG